MNDANLSENGRREYLAKWLSRVFHPFVLSVIALGLSVYLETRSWAQAALWASISLAAFLLPFAVFVGVMVFAGRYSDLDVSIREQRHGLYIVAGVGLVLLVAIFALGNAPFIGRAGAYAAVICTAVAAVVNRFSKISVHAMVAAGVAVVLLYLSVLAGLVLAVPAALVGWSRVRLKRHTWSQVIAGWSTAVACVVAVFQFLP
jgi:membrane-associated phospholipid phosphatase